MAINSTEVSYGFGQLGSAHIHNTQANTVKPPDGMVIIAITMLAETKFDVLECDTSNSAVFSGTESNNIYFGITNGNTNANSEAIDTGIKFPKGLTIYGRWTAVSIVDQDVDGGIIIYFGN